MALTEHAKKEVAQVISLLRTVYAEQGYSSTQPHSSLAKKVKKSFHDSTSPIANPNFTDVEINIFAHNLATNIRRRIDNIRNVQPVKEVIAPTQKETQRKFTDTVQHNNGNSIIREVRTDIQLSKKHDLPSKLSPNARRLIESYVNIIAEEQNLSPEKAKEIAYAEVTAELKEISHKKRKHELVLPAKIHTPHAVEPKKQVFFVSEMQAGKHSTQYSDWFGGKGHEVVATMREEVRNHINGTMIPPDKITRSSSTNKHNERHTPTAVQHNTERALKRVNASTKQAAETRAIHERYGRMLSTAMTTLKSPFGGRW